MRTIKFRVWDKKYNKWLVPNNDHASDVYVYLQTCLGELISMKEYQDRIIIQQFTGLLDKNDKEIYEGDIVEICIGAPWDNEQPIDIKGEVVFENGGWYFKGIETNSEDCYLVNYENFKIIGNILENPELIKK